MTPQIDVEELNKLTERLKQMANELREMFPGMSSVGLEAKGYETDRGHTITIHGIKSYAECTELFRSFGIGERYKTPYSDPNIGVYTHVTGTEGDLTMTAFPSDLPPSCRLEKVIEKIPKQATVDTGEFIEVERQRVVCGSEAA